MARTFSGALVPAVNADGSVQWQNWQYDELLAHLLNDLQIDPSVDLQPPGLVSAQGLPWKVDAGTVTNSFAASTNSNLVVVSHRLGRAPIAVVVTALASPAFGQIPRYNALSYTATAFSVNCEITTAFNGSIRGTWVAIG